ncbi:MAG: hypothetical protein ACO4AI_06315 [Prochlorothrix sp.]
MLMTVSSFAQIFGIPVLSNLLEDIHRSNNTRKPRLIVMDGQATHHNPNSCVGTGRKLGLFEVPITGY